MILDERLEFADATAVGTPNNTTVNVGDIIDLGAGGNDPGNGKGMYLVIQVVSAITSGGSSIVRFVLASDSTTTIAVDGTQTKHVQSDEIAVASLVAGFQLVLPLPLGADWPYERYLAFQITETGSVVLTGGTVNAFLTFDPNGWKAYAAATN